MAATSFNTENRTYRQLLGSGLSYRIPRFQRDYSWSEGEWEDFWADIQGVLSDDGEPALYMGFLVLQTEDDRAYEVIDGQQRLTTSSLIVLAAMRLLKNLPGDEKNSDDNKRRLEQLRATYIGYLDPVTLTTHNKLSLNRHNDDYYRDHLATLTDNLPQQKLPASTQAMCKGFEWFEQQLREQIKSAVDPGKALAEFVETLSDKLFFTVITVADQLNAYRVFETLNARGVRLSATDLLKNHLFSTWARDAKAADELDNLERRWEKIVDRVGSDKFPDFLRMHWNSRQGFTRETELFKVIRNRIRSRKAVSVLLHAMDEDVGTYRALTQPESAPLDWRPSVQELQMFSVRQPYPMLMAAKRKLSKADFGKLLKATVVIAFRYNIIGAQNPGKQEPVYHKAAMQLRSGEATSLAEVLAILSPIYPRNKAFKAAFAEKTIKTTTQGRNARVVRYILGKLEKPVGGVDFDVDPPPHYTIEHVLPQSQGSGWGAFSDHDQKNFVHRLGNMTLLEESENRKIGNKPYAKKRPVLQASKLRLTARLAEANADWQPEQLIARQQQLANVASNVWRIAQLP